MHDLLYRQKKIQEKRKHTPRKEFVKEICSWYTFSFYKNWEIISNFPPTWRLWGVLTTREDLENNFFDIENQWSFFKTLHHLFLQNKVPWVSHYWDNENCEYSTTVNNSKNIYLSSNLTWCENVTYSYSIKYSTDIHNSVLVRDNASCVYDSYAVFRSHEVFYSTNIKNSHQIWFSNNLTWCRECLYCDDLEHQSFCIQNKAYSEEEYYKLKNKFLSEKNNFTRTATWTLMGYIPFTEDVENWFATSYLKEGRNICFWWNPNWAERYYDSFSIWRWSDMYAWVNSWWLFSHAYCCYNVWRWTHTFYCMHVQACSYCLWCIWLKNKSYCIFNKQYSKEDRYVEVDRIFTQMEEEWVLWKFFPWWMSPFYFNDTAAYLIDDSFTKEEVEADGFLRRDEEIQVDIPDMTKLVLNSQLHEYENFENWSWNISHDILDKVIQDDSWNAYRITKMEYDFLVKYWLPLPRLHWLDRLRSHFHVTKTK